MKFLIMPAILTLSLTSFNLLYADEQFEIKNDLYYSQINAPTSTVHHQGLNVDGTLVIDIRTFYNPEGYITKSIISEPNKDIAEQFTTPIKDIKREILVSTTNENIQSINFGFPPSLTYLLLIVMIYWLTLNSMSRAILSSKRFLLKIK